MLRSFRVYYNHFTGCFKKRKKRYKKTLQKRNGTKRQTQVAFGLLYGDQDSCHQAGSMAENAKMVTLAKTGPGQGGGKEYSGKHPAKRCKVWMLRKVRQVEEGGKQ